MKNYEIHEIALCFPEMDEAQYEKLKEDVNIRGVLTPLWLFEGKVLDGRHRYRAAVETGQHCVFNHYTGVDPVGFVIAMNDIRRHLTVGQRAMAASQLAQLSAGKQVANTAPAVLQAAAAQAVGVSVDSVQRARVVQEGGTPEEIAAVSAGTAAVRTVARAVRARTPRKPATKADATDPAIANAINHIGVIYGPKVLDALKKDTFENLRAKKDLLALAKMSDKDMKRVEALVIVEHWKPCRALKFLDDIIDVDDKIGALINRCIANHGTYSIALSGYAFNVTKMKK